MIILAMDTSTDYLSLAILKGGRLAARFHKKAHRKHSMLLVPMIDKLLKKAKLRIKDVDCLAISVGPGSFTGLRIGVTVVKGLAYALKKKIVSVPTLDVIARNAKGFNGIICPVLDARKNKVYACLYKSDKKAIKKISKYLLLPAEDLLKKFYTVRHNIFLFGDVAGRIFTGDIERAPKFRSGGWGVQETHQHDSILLVPPTKNLGCSMAGPVKIIVKDWHPRAETVARLAMEDYKKKKFVKAEDLEPMYLYSRECDIKGI